VEKLCRNIPSEKVGWLRVVNKRRFNQAEAHVVVVTSGYE